MINFNSKGNPIKIVFKRGDTTQEPNYFDNGSQIVGARPLTRPIAEPANGTVTINRISSKEPTARIGSGLSATTELYVGDQIQITLKCGSNYRISAIKITQGSKTLTTYDNNHTGNATTYTTSTFTVASTDQIICSATLDAKFTYNFTLSGPAAKEAFITSIRNNTQNSNGTIGSSTSASVSAYARDNIAISYKMNSGWGGERANTNSSVNDSNTYTIGMYAAASGGTWDTHLARTFLVTVSKGIRAQNGSFTFSGSGYSKTINVNDTDSNTFFGFSINNLGLKVSSSGSASGRYYQGGKCAYAGKASSAKLGSFYTTMGGDSGSIEQTYSENAAWTSSITSPSANRVTIVDGPATLYLKQPQYAVYSRCMLMIQGYTYHNGFEWGARGSGGYVNGINTNYPGSQYVTPSRVNTHDVYLNYSTNVDTPKDYLTILSGNSYAQTVNNRDGGSGIKGFGTTSQSGGLGDFCGGNYPVKNLDGQKFAFTDANYDMTADKNDSRTSQQRNGSGTNVFGDYPNGNGTVYLVMNSGRTLRDVVSQAIKIDDAWYETSGQTTIYYVGASVYQTAIYTDADVLY